jgi:uncharacterized protein DUF4154
MNMPSRTARARSRWTALACLLLAPFVQGRTADATTQVSEHDLKAALIYRTAKFIDWPSTAFTSSKDMFVLCVVGADTAALTAFRALEGKTIGARAVTVRRITGDMLDVRQCHIAFFPLNASDDIGYAVDKLEGAPVLTIGEEQNFVRRGGMLGLLTRNERVHFTINLAASRKAELNFNPQLLQLATVMDEAPR